MKKYNLSNIMKRAWELVKKAGLCISEGLKLAWKEAKHMKEREEYIEFMYNYKNEYNCENCPENRGDFPHDKLPCGQQNCWVTCHCKEM